MESISDRIVSVVSDDRLGNLKQTIKVMQADIAELLSHYTDAESVSLEIVRKGDAFELTAVATASRIYEVGKILS